MSSLASGDVSGGFSFGREMVCPQMGCLHVLQLCSSGKRPKYILDSLAVGYTSARGWPLAGLRLCPGALLCITPQSLSFLEPGSARPRSLPFHAAGLNQVEGGGGWESEGGRCAGGFPGAGKLEQTPALAVSGRIITLDLLPRRLSPHLAEVSDPRGRCIAKSYPRRGLFLRVSWAGARLPATSCHGAARKGSAGGRRRPRGCGVLRARLCEALVAGGTWRGADGMAVVMLACADVEVLGRGARHSFVGVKDCLNGRACVRRCVFAFSSFMYIFLDSGEFLVGYNGSPLRALI